ncbi:hypothetical protein UCRPA7_673 [Phaeoacremonium minimum UCRPA7]|uniref:DUF676 domain-containing protein n=1 Tax=Phaeoacremonium minimum (strain UCR-PA7) TaxID=1286976 RepID=R8BWU6_PHAM7|nr:hypothetical protein UCRPA7_673 [Phaeoacremonium minimum UCRPA7]EOO03828.1 hypothetical protein UCRPA7_673 [Phaeoacremonium minimum UCRPA7]
MSRILLLCFIHGFKGNDDTFGTFPADLKTTVSAQLPDHRVESVVYPKYETKGELSECTAGFLDWLKERVMELRKAHLEKPWPPNDRNVGVILVAHSMGGFVASDSLFRILNDRAADDNQSGPIFPLIQGILSFDTPYNGLARSMFVYGAFSNYQKVSSVFNVMTALSAAPASLGLALKRGATSIPGASRVSNPAWKTWQLVAVRTGTVGAIAAGGVAAYVHRKKIVEGVQSMRNLNKQSVIEGYQQGVDRLGQGLAYVNRGNVGHSFAWLSDHFTFVGVLMKQNELNRRLERMAVLQGVGIHDFYASLGENGYWSGGHVVKNAEDEIQAHMSMFNPLKNEEYSVMMEQAGKLVVKWFNDDIEIVDDPKLAQPAPEEEPEKAVKATTDGIEVADESSVTKDDDTKTSSELPDESPVDIAAAASLVPLPDDSEETVGEVTPDEKEKQTYMRYLMGVAQQAGTGIQQAGTGLKGLIPSKLPNVESFGKPNMPNVSLPSVSMPSVSLWGKKQESNVSDTAAQEQKPVGGSEAKTDAAPASSDKEETILESSK